MTHRCTIDGDHVGDVNPAAAVAELMVRRRRKTVG